MNDATEALLLLGGLAIVGLTAAFIVINMRAPARQPESTEVIVTPPPRRGSR
jgi:hypothetical protein